MKLSLSPVRHSRSSSVRSRSSPRSARRALGPPRSAATPLHCSSPGAPAPPPRERSSRPQARCQSPRALCEDPPGRPSTARPHPLPPRASLPSRPAFSRLRLPQPCGRHRTQGASQSQGRARGREDPHRGQRRGQEAAASGSRAQGARGRPDDAPTATLDGPGSVGWRFLMLTRHAAECIRHYIPRAKLIVIMRDPPSAHARSARTCYGSPALTSQAPITPHQQPAKKATTVKRATARRSSGSSVSGRAPPVSARSRHPSAPRPRPIATGGGTTR
jgi:hypothetical protein